MSNATLINEDQSIGAHSDLLGLLLQEQQEMTAVERFASLHEAEPAGCPSQQYESLLPLSPLKEGEQYAFSVDLDRCSGCKACVTACHNMNGLDEEEAWRDVGLLYSKEPQAPRMQHITSACHHCVDPACMKACPTNSYEKDPVTGIVKHLDDQCFGCQYCTLACPYGVPKYHEQKGIVRKCDLCSQRLGRNEPPACAQACPHEAISVTKVDQESARQRAEKGEFLTSAHDPSFTVPTTIYRSEKPLSASLLRGDQHQLQPEHAHVPLVVMLVLIQASVGGFLFLQLGQTWLGEQLSHLFFAIMAVLFFGVSQIALAASTLHLGRPLYAFRGVLGFRHSWMSREIVAFGLYVATAGAYVSSFWIPTGWMPLQDAIQTSGGWPTIATGLIGIGCSVMIYQCTQRAFWNGFDTTCKFMLSALVGGAAIWLAVAPLLSVLLGTNFFSPAVQSGLGVLAGTLAVALIFKLVLETSILRHLVQEDDDQRKSARLLLGPLKLAMLTRLLCGGMGVLSSTILWEWSAHFSPPTIMTLAMVAGGTAILGELAERFQFFAAVVAPKMPGGVSA